MDILEIINSSTDKKAVPAERPAAPVPVRPETAPPTLDHLPPTDDFAAQVLRRLYLRGRAYLSQVAVDMEKLGEKLQTDEGVRRLAEQIKDDAFATALATEVNAAKQVIEGKLSLLQTQKDELVEKKTEINEDLQAVRSSFKPAKVIAERELELLEQDGELSRQLSETINRIKDFQPLSEILNRIGLGEDDQTSSVGGVYRLSQLVEELGQKQESVSALIRQLRIKGLLPPQGKRGIYTSQERRIILDIAHSKSVSEISREWGNAVTTLKQLIETRLTESTDYYNLGKGSERDAYRVTPVGMKKLKAAISLTRARQ